MHFLPVALFIESSRVGIKLSEQRTSEVGIETIKPRRDI